MQKRIVDRHPIICPAGLPYDYSENVARCMHYYSLEDKVNALKPKEISTFTYKLPPLKNTRNCGIFTESHDLLRPKVKTRFQTLINDLKETTYQSYWDACDGKGKDSTGKLPVEIDPYSTTFGIPSTKELSVKELVSPDKCYNQVLIESMEGHELYRKSHNDYYLNEHVTRNYLKPPFNPEHIFGVRSGYDSRGIWAKCCLKSKYKNDYTVANQIQTDYKMQNSSKLGQCFTPNNNINCVPEGHSFGIPLKSWYGVPNLLTENPPNQKKRNIQDYMAHINPLRRQLKKRNNNNWFSFSKFLMSLKYYDKDHTGWIPLSIAYEICSCFNVKFDKELMEPFLVLLNIIRGDKINYTQFVDVLNWKSNFPNFVLEYCTFCSPDEKQYYETSYNAAINDYKTIDNSKCPAAGLPISRNDITEPHLPADTFKADLDSFGPETDAQTIMYPSIYTTYGLSFYDFFLPRSPEQIRCIFENVGYEFNDEKFKKLWEESWQNDKTGLVCVDTFNKLVKKYKIPKRQKESKKETEQCCCKKS